MSSSTYTTLTEAELRTEMWRIEGELERRRLEAHAATPAEGMPSEDDFALLERKWSHESMGTLLEAGDEACNRETRVALAWLWNGTVVAHENAYDAMPSTGHVANAIHERLADLLLAGGGEDTTDLRDLSEPPSFGGRGCLCRLYDDGGPESGPSLGVAINEQCPLHSYLLADPNEDPAAHAPGCGQHGPCDCEAHDRSYIYRGIE